MHAGVNDHHGIGCSGGQALGKHTLLVKVHLPSCVGGCSQRHHIAHASILAGDDVNHVDAFAQLVDGPIEFVGLAEDLFRARKHKADDEGFVSREQFAHRSRGAIGSHQISVEDFGVVQNDRIGAEIRLVKDRRESQKGQSHQGAEDGYGEQKPTAEGVDHIAQQGECCG